MRASAVSARVDDASKARVFAAERAISCVLMAVKSAGLVVSIRSASSRALASVRIPESMTRWYGVRGLSRSGSFSRVYSSASRSLGGRGEEVQPYFDQSVMGVEEAQLSGGVVAVVEGVPEDHIAVFLLDVGVFVGLVRPGPGEVNVFLPDPGDHRVVDELPAVVAIQTNHGERRSRHDLSHRWGRSGRPGPPR